MCADTNVVSYMHINYCKLSVDIVIIVDNVIYNSSFFQPFIDAPSQDIQACDVSNKLYNVKLISKVKC